MDLEFEFKITQGGDDDDASSGVRITKEKSGPVFISKETESTFILIAHLKGVSPGYRTNHVDIDINEEGTRIGITVEKPVQEMAMSGSSRWSMHKKQVVIKGFKKVFQIPDGVVLNQIKAKFSEQDSSLRIIMPKVVKGVVGVGVEELKEEGAVISRPKMTQAASEEVPRKDGRNTKKEENFRVKGKVVNAEEYVKETEVDDQQLQAKDLREIQDNATKTVREDGKETDGGVKHHKIPGATPPQVAKLSQETEVTKPGIEIPALTLPHSNKMPKERPEKNEVGKCESSEKPAASGKSGMLRTPLILGGSALFVTLVLLAINRFRKRKQ